LDSPTVNLVARWRKGDQQAAQQLFERYVSQLVALARSRLSTQLAQRIDPEDVVQSAYRSFFVHSREGRYEFQHGGDLWRLLVATTLHKLHDQIKHHKAQKRAVEAEQGYGSEDSLFGISPETLSREPSPVEALAVADELQGVMRDLDPLQRRVLELRLEGHNVDEIAAATERCPMTIRRVLERIKKRLDHEMPGNGA
jgi:RNA polymerase sigma-70 factor (ECF subfamily)